MCTVTFIPTETGFFLTSSRDEKTSRKTIPPLAYIDSGEKLIYPKDEVAGGTWIAVSPKGRAACLLNGAFFNHKKLDKYEKSRGLILLESFLYQSATEFFADCDFKSIEPFTLLTLDYQSGSLTHFYELRWDGDQKHIKKLNSKEQKIWSSSTLYSPNVQHERSKLFFAWTENNKAENDKLILSFHTKKHGLSASNDILMEGEGDLRTVSVSQISFNNEQCNFRYLDTSQELEYVTAIKSILNESV